MTVSARISDDHQVVTIYINGRFDLSVYREFSRILEGVPYRHARCVIDMSRTDHVHDSGLGMLFQLRQRLRPAKIDVVGCSAKTREALVRLNFFPDKDRQQTANAQGKHRNVAEAAGGY